jgi:hypothetical protein
LKFDNKMKLDGNPFPQNLIGFSVNMATAEEEGKVKVLTSARAKQDGSVDPAQQITVEQVHKEASRILKSQIEVGESSKSKTRVLRVFSLTSGSVSKRKNATRNRNTRRRSRGLKRRRTEENGKNMHESRSVRIGDVRSSGTAGMKV